MDLLAVQGTLKSLLQRHSWKASSLRCSAFFIVQLSHPYMTTGKTTALTRWTFVGKLTCVLFNMLSRLVMTFLPRSKCLLISWLQSPSAVINSIQLNRLYIIHFDKYWIFLFYIINHGYLNELVLSIDTEINFLAQMRILFAYMK